MDLKDVIAGTQRTPNQNLINPVKVSQVVRPTGFYKSLILDVLSVGFALLFGYTYYGYLTVGLSPWFVLAALLIFSAVSVLQVFLEKNIARRTLVALGEAVALVALFSQYDDWQILSVTGLIVFGVLLWGYWRSRTYLTNSIEVAFFRTTRDVLGKVTTAALLFMILVYAPQAKGDGIFVPRQSFKTFFDWSSGFLNNFYPDIRFTGSFGELSQNFAKVELQNNPTFNALSPSAKNAALKQAVAQLSGEVARATGVAPAPSESTSDVVYDYIVAALANWQTQLQNKFLIGWAIVIFLLLRTIGVVFVWAAQFVSLIFYEILIALGFMHIAEATQTKETLEY